MNELDDGEIIKTSSGCFVIENGIPKKISSKGILGVDLIDFESLPVGAEFRIKLTKYDESSSAYHGHGFCQYFNLPEGTMCEPVMMESIRSVSNISDHSIGSKVALIGEIKDVFPETESILISLMTDLDGTLSKTSLGLNKGFVILLKKQPGY